MTLVVLGLVEAGSSGWTAPVTLGSLAAGVALIAAFVRIEATAAEPILPLRLLAHRTRSSANVARGLGYAGMYGAIFFLTQFLQDIQHHSPLITGIGFLPTPTSVFLSSQITSRILVDRVSPKLLMVSGSVLSALGLIVMTQLGAGTPYVEVLGGLVLIGSGMGLSFVSLTTASLAGVEPADAGAASGLINVMQQVGAALGLAVLVTVFDTVNHPGPAGLGSGTANATGAAAAAARSALVHGLDITFWVGVAFAAAALAMVVIGVRGPDATRPERLGDELDVEVLAEAAA